MGAATSERWRALLCGALVVLATFALFSPSIGYDFISLDDVQYIVENPTVAGGLTWASAKAAWTETTESYWAPLLWTSFMVDVELFGLEPWGFHLVNVALFSLNAGLVFWLVRRWTGGRTGTGLAVALLWAFHPARVESVAWVVERKDVLSGLFFLLGLGAYVEGRRGNLRGGVAWAWLCMAIGGTAKQIVIVMPAAMVLLDLWPLARTNWDRMGRDVWRLALEKWAFWALAMGLAGLPFCLHQTAGAMIESSLGERLAMVPIHYLFYFRKWLWPSGLGVLQGNLPFEGWAFAAGVGILGGTTWGLWRIRKSAPCGLWGWAWFVGTLFPLSGLVWAGSERLATRFLYIPQIGLTLAVALGATDLLRKRGWKAVWGAAACAAVVATYAVATLRLLPHWRNSRSIHERVLQVNPNSVHAFDNLAQAHFKLGNFSEWQAFLADYRRQRPESGIADIHYAWWMAAMVGDVDASVAAVEKLTTLQPDTVEFWTWLDGRTHDRKLLGTWRDMAGICLRHRGDVERMVALRARWEGQWDDRTRANFISEMLYACWSAGRATEADALARELGEASGGAWMAQMPTRFMGRWQQGARGYAFGCFADYARWAPEDGLALNNMAWLVATAKPDGMRHARMEEWPRAAVEWAERAIELSGGRIPEVWNTLAAARANAGDFAGAVAASDRALELAVESGNGSLEALVRERAERYRAGMPWRE